MICITKSVTVYMFQTDSFFYFHSGLLDQNIFSDGGELRIKGVPRDLKHLKTKQKWGYEKNTIIIIFKNKLTK